MLVTKAFGKIDLRPRILSKSTIIQASTLVDKYVLSLNCICSWEQLKKLSFQDMNIEVKRYLCLNMVIIQVQAGLSCIKALPFDVGDQSYFELLEIEFRTVIDYKTNAFEFILQHDDELILSFLATLLTGIIKILENIVKSHEDYNTEESKPLKIKHMEAILLMIQSGTKQTQLLERLHSNPLEFGHYTGETNRLFKKTINIIVEGLPNTSEMMERYFNVLYLFEKPYVSQLKTFLTYPSMEPEVLKKELIEKLPKEVLCIPGLESFIGGHAITMIDGSIGMSSQYILDEDVTKDIPQKRIAILMLLIIDGLCHKQRLTMSAKGKYFVNTPPEHVVKSLRG